VVALDRHAIGRLADRHRGVSGQQVHHHAFVGRIEMLDQDKGHAVAGGQRVHQLPAGIKATRRGAYSDNREISRAARTATRREGALARSRPGRFGRMSTASRHSYRLIGIGVAPPKPQRDPASNVASTKIFLTLRTSGGEPAPPSPAWLPPEWAFLTVAAYFQALGGVPGESTFLGRDRPSPRAKSGASPQGK